MEKTNKMTGDIRALVTTKRYSWIIVTQVNLCMQSLSWQPANSSGWENNQDRRLLNGDVNSQQLWWKEPVCMLIPPNICTISEQQQQSGIGQYCPSYVCFEPSTTTHAAVSQSLTLTAAWTHPHTYIHIHLTLWLIPVFPLVAHAQVPKAPWLFIFLLYLLHTLKDIKTPSKCM